METNLDVLLEKAKEGHRRSLSKLITRVEGGGKEARDVLRAIWNMTGSARIIGVTGPPGSGKSTLTDKLAKAIRSRGHRWDHACDPSIPLPAAPILGPWVR
jgi:LAO/AO transport system kinase